jgi:CheY-like chemotaxis protein
MNRKSVLLVDDDPVFVEAMTAVLETRFRVRSAGNGAEAFRRIAEERPDLIILDVMMDYLSEGFDVARRLRRDQGTAQIPIVMLTGVDQMYDYRMEVDESWVPCERYLEKPVSPGDLLAEVTALIGRP